MSRVLIVAWVIGMACSSVLAGDPEDRLAASRELVAEFGGELKGQLQEALAKGGPAQAIQVCSKIAPEVSARLSERTGWRVGRTALRVRNDVNKPQAWERAVLEDFERRKASGEDPRKMEHYEIVEDSGKKYFRYMKAIPMGAPCLACHGKKIAGDLTQLLDAHYPEDQARGFSIGEIRGAFTVTQTITVTAPPEQ
jgi:hypothetical protein